MRLLYQAKVPIIESALLVIDAQDSFKLGPRWERRDNRLFEQNVGALISAYREAALPVIFFLHTDADPGFTPGHPSLKLMDFIERRPEEALFHKRTRNAFTGTDLAEHLLERAVRRVLISGIQMEQCCETTTRVAADLGYAVDFISEATMTFPIPNLDRPGEELGVEAIKERTEYVLRGRFAQIRTVEEIRRELAAR